jgi:hypothetical protein
MSPFKMIGIALGLILVFGIILFIEFHLPSTVVVQITGTDVKRMDTGDLTRDGQAITRDVRFIYAKGKESGKDYVFRNEDTGWGWPPYFKFNTASLAARATNISKTEPDASVLVTYYGWRIPMLSMFPNAVKLRVVDDDYTHIPIFNIVFLIALVCVVGYPIYLIRRKRYKAMYED